MSSPSSRSSGAIASDEHYPHHWIGSKNPIHEQAHHITSTTSHDNFLQYYGFQTTPIAIYQMEFEDGPRVKGQPKMFHANFTHPHDGSNIVIDGKVYTHKAFSNQQAAYQKDRYGLCIVSPTLCYTLHGVVDNEKKRQERIARELRLDGEEKCAKKKRRQVFKINDSAVMVRRAGFEADYPTYAFNTNATYTIAFYSRHVAAVIHTGIRYTQNEHDVFVTITSSHGGEIQVTETKPVVMPPRKRKSIITKKEIMVTETKKELGKKRRHSDISEPISPISHPTPSSPTSPPSSPDSQLDSLMESQDVELPVTHVSESSFVMEKRARVDEMNPYDSYQTSYQTTSYGQGYSTHPLISGPSLPPSHPILLSAPSLPFLPPFPMSSPLLDFPLSDPIDPFDSLPDTIPTLSSIFSLQPIQLDGMPFTDDISWL